MSCLPAIAVRGDAAPSADDVPEMIAGCAGPVSLPIARVVRGYRLIGKSESVQKGCSL